MRIRRERFKKVGFKFSKVGNNFITSTMDKEIEDRIINQNV